MRCVRKLRKRNYRPITTCGWHKRNCAYADMPASASASQVMYGRRPAVHRPELLLAASRIFARHDSDPGREVTTDRKTFGSGTVAAIAVAPITPIPGMLSSRWLASFPRCCAMIRFSIDPISVCIARSVAASTTRLVCASTGKRASCSLAMMFSNSLIPSRPCAATMPRSANTGSLKF
jgi:hypothetical protein